MTKHIGLVSAALLLLSTLPVAAQKKAVAQKTLPTPAIRFLGASQYADQELFAAAGLKPDQRLSAAEVKAHAKQLNDTGLFKEIKFLSTPKTLTFTLTPVAQLYPMHLDNVPLALGKDLDAKLHDRFPLYRGSIPATGTMADGICRTFEEMLAAKGVKATVKASLTSGLGPQKLTAVNFTIASAAVHIGRIQLTGVSAAMQVKANVAAAGQSGNSFDTENSGLGLEHVFEDLYQDQGYAAVEVHVAQLEPTIAADQSVEIPYTVTVKEGAIYKVGTIDYPADALVKRAEVEKILQKYPSGIKRPLDLYRMAVCDAYHTKGYLDCSVVSHPSFNEATRIVNYSLEIAPGPLYRLGAVKFDGAPTAMAAKLKLAWKMAVGDAFDESYIVSFPEAAQKKDKQLAKWMQTVITTNDVTADAATHKITCIFHFAPGAQSPR